MPTNPRTEPVFALLGKRWTGQIVDLLLQGPARFGQLAAALPGLSHRVLTERLAELQQAGVVVRTGPTYALTPHGEGLRPAIDALATWCAPGAGGSHGSCAPAQAGAGHGSAGASHGPGGTGHVLAGTGHGPTGAGQGPADTGHGLCLEGRRGAWEAFSAAGERVRDALERQVQTGAGMPPSYFELLIQLRLAPGHRLRMSELAAATRSKPSRITYAVGRLERAGWVVRDGHPTDGRGSTAILTEQGIRAMDEARPAYTRVIHDHVLEPLSPHEQELLRALCEKILASFDAPLLQY